MADEKSSEDTPISPRRYSGGRGFWDPPLTKDEVKKQIEGHLKYVKLTMARASETPVIMLGPEAHEDALVATGNLWREGTKLLGGAAAGVITTADEKRWEIHGEESARTFTNHPPQTELYLIAPRTTTTEEEGIRSTMRAFAVTPKAVKEIEENQTIGSGKSFLPPKGLGLEKTEIGRNDIDALRVMIENRSSFVQQPASGTSTQGT